MIGHEFEPFLFGETGHHTDQFARKGVIEIIVKAMVHAAAVRHSSDDEDSLR